MNRRQLQRQQRAAQQDLQRVRVRKHLSADALHGAVRKSFEKVAETGNGTSQIPMTDCLMSGYAMFSLKDPSLLAFDQRRAAEDHNLNSIYGIEQARCDTQIRKRLDPVEPDSLRPAFTEIFRRAQRGKLLEDMVTMEECVLISGDGTTHFVSENLSSPACLKKTSSKTGKTTYSLQTYAAVIVRPRSAGKSSLCLPSPSSTMTGTTRTTVSATPADDGSPNSEKSILTSKPS